MAKATAPLAERIRPQSLEEIIGQQHLTGEGRILKKVVESKQLPSMILWGPPGVGKTTLAKILAKNAGMPFFTLSAVSSGVKEVRAVIETAEKAGKAVLFIDEIHRFSKSQQDSLLNAVENGTIILIGATTENPSFEVISPLLSRSQVYILESLGKDDLLKLLNRAIVEDEMLSQKQIDLKETDALLRLSGGDARRLLNIFELVINNVSDKKIVVTDALVQEFVQQKMAKYDKGGEQHYDIISAFIKSIRGSDPNAALYWLARMTEGGEDPKFIARRLLILASEDVGNANPNALLLANATFDAVTKIGYPECVINLAQCVTYLASSPKSNASYSGVKKAISLVKQTGDLSVPLHIRNAPTKLMKDLGYAKDYKYSHGFEGNFAEQEYLPEQVKGTKLYEPQNNARENELRKFLKDRWKDKYNY